ncbi:hypothetical protein J2Z35_002792 [Acetoanaerobium pronyense]|uniref:DUF4351 domain-containing protein n=1 Tax=Acetoanaerobium pronyense TaxID=1482736 RepID=A0ABS4KQS4_9FIRM|nr:DUF4351 domain-containing protein [Acetoanaerobium pronyense]MBP2028954.1 hypothetical protein [Acetoanaerobium pronyense]
MMTLADKYREEGEERGEARGEVRALIKTVIRLLTKKFGPLPAEIRTKVENLDIVTLEVLIDEILEYKSLEDAKKYIH